MDPGPEFLPEVLQQQPTEPELIEGEEATMPQKVFSDLLGSKA